MIDTALAPILAQFPATKNAFFCERYGNGHINETYLVKTECGEYILQKINKNVFRTPEAVMHNIKGVTAHLGAKYGEMGLDPKRKTLTLNPTKDGNSFFVTEEGEYYRLYDFVKDSMTLDAPKTVEEFALAGRAFSEFASMLSDFPAEELLEVIPRFHDTPNRFRLFTEAVALDPLGRAKDVAAEIDFYVKREKFMHTLMDAHHAGALPLRVTHNDTKLNNILFDATSGEALCVIDLDTVMPGFTVNDFGDAIRFGANTAAEDETDLSLVTFSLDRYRAYAAAYLEADGLTEKEKELLPEGALMMTVECGMRFLTDYLLGDTYFRIHRPQHNLDRARTQIRLAQHMEAAWDILKSMR